MGCVSFSEQSINRLIFVIRRYCVHCAVRTNPEVKLVRTTLVVQPTFFSNHSSHNGTRFTWRSLYRFVPFCSQRCIFRLLIDWRVGNCVYACELYVQSTYHARVHSTFASIVSLVDGGVSVLSTYPPLVCHKNCFLLASLLN